MPRGVYHSALSRGNLRSDQGKTVSGIPFFMLKTYEKNKQPGLKPGLAGTCTVQESFSFVIWVIKVHFEIVTANACLSQLK